MITDTTRVNALRVKLDTWETNLRANREHYTRDGRPAESIYGIDRELDLIESVRDAVWPRCETCGRTDYDAATVRPGSAHACRSCARPRKVTRFATCDRHAWLNREPRARRAEFFGEGGPAGQTGCAGGRCRMWPGVDLFSAEICHAEMVLPWTVTTPAAVR